MATFIFYLVLINLLLCLSVAQQPFLYNFCVYDRGNYTTSSTYRTSLNRLLSSLPSNASANGGFYGASVADNSTTISAIALCRGDVTQTDCRSCVNDSNVLLLRRCPNQVEAIGWYDNCMLRFSNRTILGGVSESLPAFRMTNPNNYSGNVSQFNRVLGNLMEELQTRAAAGGQLLKFATGEAAVTSFDRVYGLVQCTPDLSQLSCSNCLGDAIAQIPKYFNGRKGGRYVGPSCNIRFEQYLFYDETSETAPPPAAPPPNNSTTPTTTTGGRSDKSRTAIIAVATTVSGILVIVFAFFWWRKRQKRELESQNPEDIINVESLQFDFDTIRVATDNFSQVNKLGQGGFGAVYKGKLPNGQDVAVKRLSMDSGQGNQEFKNEVLLVAKLQHRNLVRLLGFSLKGNERLLIYEYVPNTSLDHFIFDPVKRLQLDFERRYKIIGGIARGLLYLHEDSRLRIIHRDLKASNILLDEGMNAKISDFGMARLFVVDQTQGNTSRVVGTYGYMAPEYAFHGLFSVKSDVFSFGVLVLEIVSGQKNISFRGGEDLMDLLSHAWRSWREGRAVNLVDPSLRNYSSREIMRCVHIGLLCVQENEAERPTMASVVVMLSSHSSTLPMPSEPAFLVNYTSTESGARLVQNSPGKTRSDSSQREIEKLPLSNASMSNSELYPR